MRDRWEKAAFCNPLIAVNSGKVNPSLEHAGQLNIKKLIEHTIAIGSIASLPLILVANVAKWPVWQRASGIVGRSEANSHRLAMSAWR